MNILFISHCNFQGNSAMHIFSISNQLEALGVHCVVCVPNEPDSVFSHGEPKFKVLDYSSALANGIQFPDDRGPDLIHAWTPRELVRKITQRLVALYGCHYIVHLEDNEKIILEDDLSGKPFHDISKLSVSELDRLVPEHRSHPIYSKDFLIFQSLYIFIHPFIYFPCEETYRKFSGCRDRLFFLYPFYKLL